MSGNIPPWEEESESEDDEEWFYNSIRRYAHLFMYKLSFTPTCLDISFDKILVAGKNQKVENCYEMSIFRIPAKLTTNCQEKEGMIKERDFSLVAGTTNQKYQFIQVTFVEKEILSLQEDGHVALWSIKPDSDLIIQLTNIQISSNLLRLTVLSQSSFAATTNDKVLNISVIRNDLVKLELNEQKSYSGKVAKLIKPEQDDAFVSVDCSGQIRFHRTDDFSQIFSESEAKENSVSSGFYEFPKISIFSRRQTVCAASYSQNIILTLFELPESLDDKVIRSKSRYELQIPEHVSDEEISSIQWIQIQNESSTDDDLPNLMIVTLKKIYIFALQVERENSENSHKIVRILEIFCHDGHKSNILNSIFHQTIPNLFFSSDSKNNLHAWSFNV